MPRWTLPLLWTTLVCLLSAGAVCQSGLSANSGINGADTYVAVDLTITTTATVDLPNSFYNPTTRATSNALTVAPPVQNFHLESGYDSAGGLVVNVWPTGTAVNPTTTDAEALGFMRFAGGQLTLFDQSGAPLSPVFPAGVATGWPLNLLGSNPGPSVVSHLVVPNVQNYANAIHANLTTSSSPAASYVSVPVQQGNSATWTYVPSGSNWIAQQVVLNASISNSSLTNGSASTTIQFANMNWYDNATKDAARAAKGYTATAPPAPTSGDPTGLTTQAETSSPTSVKQLGGPQNIVFMHGFSSSASTWNRMTGWLNQDFRFGTEVLPGLAWYHSLSSQGTDLVNAINSAGGSNYILVGHSQGGLISRYAAQQYQTANNKQNTVAGIVTLDTPHQGAPIAVSGSVPIIATFAGAGIWLWDSAGCSSPNDNFVCWMAAVLFFGGPVVAEAWDLSTIPSLADLTPGSPFLSQLNSFTETFQRAGVVSYTPMWFNEMRILDNAFFGWAGCDYPDAGCGERAIAQDTQIVFGEVVFFFVFSTVEEFFDPDNFDYWFSEAEVFLKILVGMEIPDVFWNAIVSGFSSSDAIVPTSSQNYPSVSAVQYPISGGDSHTGAPRSPYVHTTLDQVLKSSQFNVPTQASCAFAPTPSSYSISGNGGNSSFSLGTGAGCQWSTVSEAPWLSITSGTSGTSNGTVSFSAAVNPATVPRTGAIQAGNGSSTSNFTVYQAGFCYYSLSEGPIVAVPPSGESNTVTVTTTSDCVWSAVSNASWLTITAGPSGTGSGSFTYTAAPNSGSSDLSGTITVMSQTLTVVEGSPVGSPGTGTVTINGSPQSITFNPCQNNVYPAPNYCPQTIYEGGNVAVAVGSQTYTTGYGQGTTAAQIASALASQMNHALSTISATVSGTTISIRSTLNGAATNYPLSTSYQYDTTDFSYPAFTGAASGTQLTGGAD